MYDSTFLGEIRDRAVDLYQNHNVLPPEHIRQAMQEAKVPEDKLWETRKAIGGLGLVETPPPSLKLLGSKKVFARKNFIGNPFAEMRLPTGDRDPA